MTISIPSTFNPNAAPYQTGNRPEIFSIDQHQKINCGNYLNQRISDLCKKLNLGYCFFPIQAKNISLAIKNNDITVIFGLYDLITTIDWSVFDQECQVNGKKIVVITDNYFDQEKIQKKFKNIKFYSRPKLLGVTSFYHNHQWPKISPSRLYNCFIQRVDSVRQSWFYFLFNQQLLDRGYVSFLLRQYDEYFPNSIPFSEKELFEYIHQNYQLNKLVTFDQAFSALKDKVPYRNFPEINDLLPTILDSKYSLVLETFATEDDKDYWCFTEKSMRSIQVPNITLLFAQKNANNVLVNLGFQVNPICLSYDNLSWIQRQAAILDILKNDAIPCSPLTAEMASHNRSILASWKTDILKNDFFDDIWDAIISKSL